MTSRTRHVATKRAHKLSNLGRELRSQYTYNATPSDVYHIGRSLERDRAKGLIPRMKYDLF
jgi:hypothetical protein